jgi:hypothetical protein
VNIPEFVGPELLGLAFIIVFFLLMLIFAFLGRRRQGRTLREIPAFDHLGRAFGLSVEAGKRLHVSLGRGGILGLPAGSALIGLSVLERIARFASVSDRPPIATSGESALAILSQDTLRSTHRRAGAEAQYDPASGQLTGLTPFAYAAGTLPVIFDEQTSAHILAGHFGSEVGLIADAAGRSHSLTLAGSDNLAAQAVLVAAAQEPLIGEELYAAGAYMQAGTLHVASLHAQDVLRWLLVLAILAGVALKLAGVL